jgi:hypothetical protein
LRMVTGRIWEPSIAAPRAAGNAQRMVTTVLLTF